MSFVYRSIFVAQKIDKENFEEIDREWCKNSLYLVQAEKRMRKALKIEAFRL